MNRTTLECPICNKQISRSNYNRHVGSEKCLNPKPEYIYDILDYKNLKCNFCKKPYENISSLKNHQLRCYLNENRIKKTFNRKGNGGKNQYTKAKELGLPKPTLSKETIEKMRIASSNRKHSQETKNKISNIRKKYLDENPDKIPYLLNHSSKISYPEKYFIECFKELNNIEFQYRVGRYVLDFANVDKKVYFEVDGETHYTNLKTIEIDSRRTKFLRDKGWSEYRVRWKEFKKLDESDRKNFVKEIINKLNN